MFEALKTTVCQIAVFMICAQAIAHFRPREVYEKYLRMLLGVMILIQIFQPFCKLFFGVTGQELSATVVTFQQEFDSSMASAARQSALAAQRQEDLSLLELQERLAEQESQPESAAAEVKGTASESSGGAEGTGTASESSGGTEETANRIEAASPANANPKGGDTTQIQQVQVKQIQIKTEISEGE